MLDEDGEGGLFVGEVAHIVAEKESGPRGKSEPPGGDRNGFPNLMLMCPEHHSVIDTKVQAYGVAKLVKMKAQHEDWVRQRVSPESRFMVVVEDPSLLPETAHLNIVPVLHMPKLVFMAPCTLTEGKIAEVLRKGCKHTNGVALPFICRGSNLLAFDDLSKADGPFASVIDPGAAFHEPARTWWRDADRSRWYVQLLNRALNKLTGRLGLNLDKQHQRYYFEPDDGPTPRSVTYTSLQGRQATRTVVRRPIVRKTKEPKKYWEHYAVGLRFHHLHQDDWGLSIRPERRFTRDGFAPLTPKGTGRRATSRKSHMYNLDVLKEVHFWCEYLRNGDPRIHLPLGAQDVVLAPTPISLSVEWPGVADDHYEVRFFRPEESLFTLANYRRILQREADLGEWDVVDDEDWAEDM